MGFLLGIDVGTSGTKTLLADETGAVRAEVTKEYPCHTPKPGWSEQDPEDWWTATRASVRAALRKAKAKAADVSAVGLSGQMHGLVCLDGDGAVLRRAILWNDQRTAAECAEITKRAGGPKALIRLVANPALTGFTAPKILWVRRHEPRVYESSRIFLLPKDYVRYRLTGEYATEVSDASGTLLLDVKKRRWSTALLSKLGIDPALLPRVHESPEVTGALHAEAAKGLGLTAGTPVVGGGGDQAAGAVGNGIVRPGVVSAMLGTSGVVFAHAETPEADPEGRVHAFCHAVPGAWHVMGVVLAAGGALQWFRNTLCQEEIRRAKSSGRDPYDLITAAAAETPPGAEGLLFLPYLTGERTPHADPDARACFVGLSPRHGKGHMARAVMEGATYAMRDSLEIMVGLGIDPREIRLSGGGARSAFWRQLQADVYGRNVCVTNATAGSAYGAMLLAGVGAGTWTSVPEACRATIRVTDRTRRNPKTSRIHDRFHPIYGRLYRSLREDFRALAEAVRDEETA